MKITVRRVTTFIDKFDGDVPKSKLKPFSFNITYKYAEAGE